MDDFCNNVSAIQLRKGRFHKTRTIFWSVLPFLALQSALAAPFSSTWNGATSHDWSVATNWTSDVPGLSDSPFDTAVLVGETPQSSISHSATSVLNTIQLDGNTSVVLTNTPTGNMTLDGAGILTDTAFNTGSHIVNAGTFIMRGASGISSVGSQYAPVLFDNSGMLLFQGTSSANDAIVTNTGTLDISEASSGVSLAGLEGSGFVIVGSNTLTIEAATPHTISGVITGTGALVKNGLAMMILTADSPFSGVMTINSGTVQIGNGGSEGSFAGDIVNNASLVFDRSDTLTYPGVLSGTGDVVKMGTSTLIFNGINTYTGSTTVNNGSLLVGDILHQDASISSEVIVNTGGTLGGFGYINGDVRNDGTVMAGPYLTVPHETTIHIAESDEQEVLDLINSKAVIGTLDVVGDYTQTANGRYITAINAMGDADHLAIEGKATLDGTLSVDVSAGSNPAKQYTILTANGGVFGQFANVDSLGVLAQDYLIAKLRYLPNAVVLEEVKRELGYARSTIQNDGLIIYDHDNMMIHFSDTIEGSGGLIKNGDGTLVIEGQNTYTGTTIVNGGTLLVGSAGNPDASVSSDVLINSGGTVGGYGTIGGDVQNNSGGTLSPGASIGTTNITGNYVQAANANLLIEINAAGQNDLLAITGSATLGGTLSIDATGGFLPGNQYTFLTAVGGVSGTFTNVNSTTLNQNFVTGTVTYGANDVKISAVLNTAAMQAAAVTPYQTAVVNYIIQTGGTPTMQDYIFNATSDAALQTLLDQISGATYATQETELAFIGSHLGNQIIDHVDLHPGSQHALALWVTPYGSGVDMSSDTVSGLRSTVGGLMMGTDVPVGHGLIGLAVSGTYFDSVAENNESATTTGELYQVGLYTSYACNGWIASASIDGGMTANVDASRNVISDSTSTMSGDYQANVYSAQMRVSYDIPSAMNHVRPFVGMVAQEVTRDAFTEDGDANFALEVDSSNYNSLRSQLGMSVEMPLTEVVKLVTSAAWQHEFADTSSDVDGNVKALQNSFHVTGVEVGRESALIKAGFVIAGGQAIDVLALYEGQLMDGYQENGGKLQVNIHF